MTRIHKPGILILFALLVVSAKGADRTILFIDDHDVLYQSGTRQILQPATADREQPVIAENKPWERAIGYCSVIRHETTGKYQAWYQSYAGSEAQDPTRRVTLCYAESDDGLNWTKPDLDLFPFNEHSRTNIVLIGNGGRSVNYGAAVVFDPRDADRDRRYKLAYWDFIRKNDRWLPGLCAAFSPDGIHWTKYAEAPLLQGAYGNPEQPLTVGNSGSEPAVRPAISDVIDLMYDSTAKVFRIYSKTWIDGPDGRRFWKRAVVRSESQDFIHWSQPEFVLAPADGDSGQLHGAPTFLYAGVYLSLLQRLDFGGFDSGGTGNMPGELAVSRDGLNWFRPFQSEMFLPVSGDGKTFDAGCLWTNATPVILEDEIRFYYGAYAAWNTDIDRDGSGIGVRSISRNRFVAVQPIDTVGQVTLRPQRLNRGNQLAINADAAGGAVRVEVLNKAGYVMDGFTKYDAVPLHGDSLQHTPKWRSRTLQDLPDGSYQLRLHLQDARLFAVTFRSE